MRAVGALGQRGRVLEQRVERLGFERVVAPHPALAGRRPQLADRAHARQEHRPVEREGEQGRARVQDVAVGQDDGVGRPKVRLYPGRLDERAVDLHAVVSGRGPRELVADRRRLRPPRHDQARRGVAQPAEAAHERGHVLVLGDLPEKEQHLRPLGQPERSPRLRARHHVVVLAAVVRVRHDEGRPRGEPGVRPLRFDDPAPGQRDDAVDALHEALPEGRLGPRVEAPVRPNVVRRPHDARAPRPQRVEHPQERLGRR